MLDAVEFLEGLEWCEVIDGEFAEFIEEWVFGGFEEGFLSASLDGRFAFGDAGFSFRVEMIIFEGGEY
ncbi:MAG: hypothetical protein RL215_3195 [Planctomycetota bacterium]